MQESHVHSEPVGRDIVITRDVTWLIIQATKNPVFTAIRMDDISSVGTCTGGWLVVLKNGEYVPIAGDDPSVNLANVQKVMGLLRGN